MSARRHLLLDARVGFQEAELAPTLELDPAGRLALRPRPGTGRLLADEHGSFGGIALPTGLAVDGAGRIYVLDAARHELKRYDPCRCLFEVLPCIGGEGSAPRRLRAPQGLAVSCQGDLYVADTGNRRLQVFTIKDLALRCIWGPYRVERDGEELRLEPAHRLPSEEAEESCVPGPASFPAGTWEPWDVAVSGCAVWIADAGNGLVHRFSLAGRWLGAIEREGDDAPLALPTHLAVDREDRLYVVQEGREHVAVFDRTGRFLERLERPRDVEGRFVPAAVAVAPDGTLFLTCCTRDPRVASRTADARLYRFARSGGAEGGFALCGTSIPGCGRIAAFDADANPLALDGAAIRVLEPETLFETDGNLITTALDSRIYRCHWHRVRLTLAGGGAPPGTRVRVATFTAESAKDDGEIASLPEERWSPAGELTEPGLANWDCLVRSAAGRHLWLRISLSGDGTATPQIECVHIEFPRASSLRHLPAVYREEEESRDFLDRFLSLFDSIREETETVIETIAARFDPWATPAGTASGEADFLTWLASWIGLTLDRHWPVAKRRALLAQAHRLYALRGTPEGLRRHVRLYAEVEPQILEQFRVRRLLHLGEARLGDCAELWGDDLVQRLQLDVHSRIGSFQLLDTGDPTTDPIAHLAHRFTVYVPLRGGAPRGALSEEQQLTLRRIVELAKPAHAEAELVFVEPRLRVGHQSRVGVDTVVASYPEGVVAGETELRRGSLLGPHPDEDVPPTLRLGTTSRIGTSTLID